MRLSALVLVVAAALAVQGCSGDDTADDADETTSSTASTEPPTSSTTEPPLTGAPLVVEEQGLSVWPDFLDPATDLGGYGVILRNPNAEVMAAGVHVTTRILDEAGTELLADSALLNAVMPGQRMAVGRTLIEPLAAPTRIEVAVEVSAWLPPAADGALVAEQIVTEPEEDGGSVTKFTVRSTLPDNEEGVDATAVYRAADGRILAAESTTIEMVPAGATAEGQIRLLSPIPDVASTEVFVGRGFAAQTVG